MCDEDLAVGPLILLVIGREQAETYSAPGNFEAQSVLLRIWSSHWVGRKLGGGWTYLHTPAGDMQVLAALSSGGVVISALASWPATSDT